MFTSLSKYWGYVVGFIPDTTADAEAEFVTAALRQGGAIDSDAAVAELDHEVIGEGVGVLGQLARLTLRYSGAAHGAPSSVILKMPSQHPENRGLGDHYDVYHREGQFYESIGDRCRVRTPHCYFNHMDTDAGEFALLIEDFGGRTMISQIAGVDPNRVAEAFRAIAQIHAEWWDSPKLADIGWMPGIDDPIMLAAGENYRQATPSFLDRFGGVLPAGSAELAGRIGPNWEQMAIDGVARNPSTVCHGDFRADNLMFDDKIEGREHVGVIDWQLSFRGPPLNDVCYLMTQSMTVEDRRKHERDLVSTWYDAVCGALGSAPDGFSPDDAWNEYRACVAGLTVYPVAGGAALDLGNERGVQLLEVMAERSFAAAIDLEASDFFTV